MQKIIGNSTTTTRPSSPLTSNSSTTSIRSTKLKESSQSSTPIRNKNSSQFDINSLMMAAAAVAATTKKKPINSDDILLNSKKLNDLNNNNFMLKKEDDSSLKPNLQQSKLLNDNSNNENYEYANKTNGSRVPLVVDNSELKMNQTVVVESNDDDESDSNYLNKLRRHKQFSNGINSNAQHVNINNNKKQQLNFHEDETELNNASSCDEFDEDNKRSNDYLIDQSKSNMFNNNNNNQQSGAKKRKRQFISSQQQQQQYYENADEADGDDINENSESNQIRNKHLKINELNESTMSVSRRKSRIQYFNKNGDLDHEPKHDIEEEEEEGCISNSKYRHYEDNDDIEDGQLVKHYQQDQDDESDIENGELVRKNDDDEEPMKNHSDDEEDFNNMNQENGDICMDDEDEEEHLKKREKFKHLSSLQRNDKLNQNYFNDFNNQHQNALIANTLANLAAAANLSSSTSNSSSSSAAAVANLNNNNKIFHVDAYCYLCKKEFCNKYFLRTHLANKHKVFLNSNDLSTLSGASMSKLQNDLLDEQNQQKMQKRQAKSANTQHRSSSASSSASTSSVSSSTSNSPQPQNHLPNIVFNQNGSHHQQQQQKINAIQCKQDELMSYQKLNNDLNNSNLVEDFCELCNKQFCNKYYLKKHKFDVHGILVENNIKSYKKIDEPSLGLQSNYLSNSQNGRPTVNGLITAQSAQSNPQNGQTANSISSNPAKGLTTNINQSFNLPASLFGNSSQSHSLAIAAAAAAAAGNLSGMMFVNPYMTPIMQMPHVIPTANNSSNNSTGVTNSSSPLSSSSSTLSSNSNGEIIPVAVKSKPNDETKPTKTDDHSSQITNNDTKKPTAAKNQSVACELCKKEFFNDEFLKLHKINKHKQNMDNTPIVAAVTAQSNDSSSNHTTTTNSSSSNQTNKTPPVLASSTSPKPSQSPSLLPLNNASSLLTVGVAQNETNFDLKDDKAKLITSSTISSNKLNANQLNKIPNQFDMFNGGNPAVAAAAAAAAGISTPAIFGIMDSYFAAKMADRVTCDICNKQVCNKYFLKTHKLKVHGIADNSTGGNSGNSQMMDNEGDYEMNEYEMNDMNEMNENNKNDEENADYEAQNEFKSETNGDEDDDERSKDNLKHIKFLNQIRSTSGSPNSALAQIFNKQTLAAMGIDPNSNAAALAALAASLNYSQALNGGLNNSSSQSKPKPPALARVSCQICRKELCNKYFLKSHLLNAHHINADEMFMNSLNDMPQQQQNDKLFSELNKKFNVFNSNEQSQQQNQRQTQSPTTSMRSTSSNYANKAQKINKNGTNSSQTDDNELEEGQQIDEENHNSDNEDEDQMENSNNATAAMIANQMSFNALLNYNKMMNGTSEANGSTNEYGSNNMQPFLFECQDDSFNSNFVPCMVYLPVKSKLGSSITIKVTLKPLDNMTTESAAARAGVSESEETEEHSD